MKKEIADRWIAKLRSGEYGQTYGRLRDVDHHAFCCLGVLCDLYREDHDDLAWVDGNAVIGDLRTRASLPDELVEWSEMNSSLGNFPGSVIEELNFQHDSLAQLNDSGWSFERIGDFIEKHWEDL